MKKLFISALCGLCLFGAFASFGTQSKGDDEVALSRMRVGTRA